MRRSDSMSVRISILTFVLAGALSACGGSGQEGGAQCTAVGQRSCTSDGLSVLECRSSASDPESMVWTLVETCEAGGCVDGACSQSRPGDTLDAAGGDLTDKDAMADVPPDTVAQQVTVTIKPSAGMDLAQTQVYFAGQLVDSGAGDGSCELPLHEGDSGLVIAADPSTGHTLTNYVFLDGGAVHALAPDGAPGVSLSVRTTALATVAIHPVLFTPDPAIRAAMFSTVETSPAVAAFADYFEAHYQAAGLEATEEYQELLEDALVGVLETVEYTPPDAGRDPYDCPENLAQCRASWGFGQVMELDQDDDLVPVSGGSFVIKAELTWDQVALYSLTGLATLTRIDLSGYTAADISAEEYSGLQYYTTYPGFVQERTLVKPNKWAQLLNWMDAVSFLMDQLTSEMWDMSSSDPFKVPSEVPGVYLLRIFKGGLGKLSGDGELDYLAGSAPLFALHRQAVLMNCVNIGASTLKAMGVPSSVALSPSFASKVTQLVVVYFPENEAPTADRISNFIEDLIATAIDQMNDAILKGALKKATTWGEALNVLGKASGTAKTFAVTTQMAGFDAMDALLIRVGEPGITCDTDADCFLGTECAFGACVQSCFPDCDGKECGDDGCGGNCGVCAQGWVCSPNSGLCEPLCGDGTCDVSEDAILCPIDCCVPDCAGLECGPDPVCGQSCGACLWGDVCDNGLCVDKDSLGFTWIAIPGGTFQMGCSVGDEACESDEFPAHSVTVSPFEMLESEVTVAQYLAVAGGVDPSCDQEGDGGSDSPVENVEGDWFCEAIGGRLPTEAEWEYAARGGTTSRYYCGDDESCLDQIAWYSDNAGNHKHSVKQKEPNGFGLYDMTGNLSEWVSDAYHSSYDGAPATGYPQWGIPVMGYQVFRGGSYHDCCQDGLRVSDRYANTYKAYCNSGIRCVRD